MDVKTGWQTAMESWQKRFGKKLIRICEVVDEGLLSSPLDSRNSFSIFATSSDSFLPARTTVSAQQSSVVLLEAPVTPVEVAPGLLASPAELLALLNQTAVIHLALEPANGLTIRVDSVPAVDLAQLYQSLTGYQLNP